MRTVFSLLSVAAIALAGCPADERANDPTATIAGTTEEVPEDEDDDSGPPPTTETSGPMETTTGDESGSTSGPPDTGMCSGNRVCLGKPPLGWTGPLVVAKGQVPEDLPTCKDPYPGNDLTRFEGYHSPGAAECTCECGLSGATCSFYYYTNTWSGTPSTNCSYYNTGAQGCQEITYPLTDGWLQIYSYVNFGASCDQSAEEVIPEIPWDAVVRGCTGGVETDEVCNADGGLCYKKPDDGFEQEICYMAEGDLPCPPNTDYQEKTIRYSAVEDSRDCTSCQCGMLTSCLNSYDIYDNTDCSGAPIDTVNNGTCNTNVTAQAIDFNTDDLSCPVLSDSEPEGESTPIGPWTYCCAPIP